MNQNKLTAWALSALMAGNIATAAAQEEKTTESISYPEIRLGGTPVSQLMDGEEYAMQNSNATLACRNLYWEWGTYLRTRSDGAINDVTFVAHEHAADGQNQWSFQVTSETGNGQYLGRTNGSNASLVSDEMLWTVTYEESDTDEGNGFLLLPSGDNANEGHELKMNGSGDWVVSYADGTSTDKTDGTSHWSFIRTADLNSDAVAEYNAANLRLYQYLVEASQMYDRGMTMMAESYNAGVAVYNKTGNTTEELNAATESIMKAIAASVSGYEPFVPATFGIVNPSFENVTSQHGSEVSVPFGWTMTKNGNEVVTPVDWSWCGANTDGENKDGDYLWGIWHWGEYGDIVLSQTVSGLPNGLWKLTARLMNNNTEQGNWARIFASTSSMLAGGSADYALLPEGEQCNYANAWASGDGDMSRVMTVYAHVVDGTLQMGVKTNGFFKVDDFQLTYLGAETVTTSVAIGAEGAATIVTAAPVDFSMAANVKVYKVVADEGAVIALQEVSGVVAAGEPLLLVGAQGVYDFAIMPAVSVPLKDNQLRVANGDVEADGSTVFTLEDGEQGVGFYLQPQGTQINNGQVYLTVDVGTEMTFFPVDGKTTGIYKVQRTFDDKSCGIFNLSGCQIDGLQRGVNVMAGKKMIVR